MTGTRMTLKMCRMNYLMFSSPALMFDVKGAHLGHNNYMDNSYNNNYNEESYSSTDSDNSSDALKNSYNNYDDQYNSNNYKTNYDHNYNYNNVVAKQNGPFLNQYDNKNNNVAIKLNKPDTVQNQYWTNNAEEVNNKDRKVNYMRYYALFFVMACVILVLGACWFYFLQNGGSADHHDNILGGADDDPASRLAGNVFTCWHHCCHYCCFQCCNHWTCTCCYYCGILYESNDIKCECTGCCQCVYLQGHALRLCKHGNCTQHDLTEGSERTYRFCCTTDDQCFYCITNQPVEHVNGHTVRLAPYWGDENNSH